MSHQQADRVRRCRAALKAVIAEMEEALGVTEALPVTMPTLKAIEEADRLTRE